MIDAGTAAFDPTDLERTDDPYALLAPLRAGGAVRKLANGYWAVTGHAAALEALRHPRCGTSPIALRYLDGLPVPEVAALIESGVNPAVAILIVAGGSAAGGIIVLLAGKKAIGAVDPTPTRTITSLQNDARMAKESLT